MKLTPVLSVLWLLVTASSPAKAEDLTSAIATAQNTTYLVCEEFVVSGEYLNGFTGEMESKTFSITSGSCTLAVQISDTEIVTTKTALSAPHMLLYSILTNIYNPSEVTVATSDMRVSFWRNLYDSEGIAFQTSRINFTMPVRNMSQATILENLRKGTTLNFDRTPSDETPFQVEDPGTGYSGLVRFTFVAPFPRDNYLTLNRTVPVVGTKTATITADPSSQAVSTPSFTTHEGQITNNHVLDQRIRSRVQTSGTLLEITNKSGISGASIGGVVVDGAGSLVGLTAMNTTRTGEAEVPCGSGMTSICLHYVISGSDVASFIGTQRKH